LVDSLRINEVITYWSAENPGTLMTHRIIEIHDVGPALVFQTKGDANEDPDKYVMSASQVVGRMVFRIPYVGVVAQLSHSALGFVLLVLAPGIVVIGAEVYSIVKKEQN